MELTIQIQKYMERPFPLWETTLTHQLIQHKWKELLAKELNSRLNYSTARVWLNNPSLELDKRKEVVENNLYIEMPSAQLQSFYGEHGLELLAEDEIEESRTLPKLNKAFSVLGLIEPAYDYVTELVQSIHILRQPDAEIDVSYSHPQIPFSIFVSVCDDDSMVSNLRVAESILHEAMHLKLTLIEAIVPLIKPDLVSLYYSPWRDEDRPVRGVLHGLFVFRAIYQFYEGLIATHKLHDAASYLKGRNEQIGTEISSIKKFPQSPGLTEYGASLAKNLLP